MTAAAPKPNPLGYMAAHGRALLRGSYSLTPVKPGTKEAFLPDWRHRPLDADGVNRYGACSVGILSGQGDYPLAPLDIDIRHEGVAETVLAFCRARLPGAPERIGEAPKTMLFFRAPRAGMKKRVSAAYVDPANRTGPDGKPLLHRIEVQGDGQQVVAFGVHPATGRLYQWSGVALDQIDASALPVLPESFIDELFAEFERLAALHGLRPHSAAPKLVAVTAAPRDPLDKAVYEAERARAVESVTPATIADLRAALTHIDPEDHDSWVRMGHALYCLGDTGRELWFEYSARGATFVNGKKDPAATWDSFKGEQTDFRAVFAEAQRRDWKNPRKRDGGDYADRVDRSDTGNANLLACLAGGNLRFVPDRDVWLWWDGTQHVVDEHRAIAQREALRVAEHYDGEAADFERRADDASLDDEDRKRLAKTAKSVRQWEKKCRSRSAIDAMLTLASRLEAIQLPSSKLDCDRWLLGVQNGVVDLRTGALRPAGRDDYVTKRCGAAFVPGAPAPRFRRFVEEITASPLPVTYGADGTVDRSSVGRYSPRPALVAYAQTMLGYCMTGEVREHKMFIAVGPGANGKSLLFETAQRVAGPHFITLKPEALMAGRFDADPERPTPIARSLMGARAALSSESRDGQKLDPTIVKRHTGDSRMTARGLHEKAVEFDITHKLVLLTNHKPALDHLDAAIRGRLHLIPFDMRWNRPGEPDRNPELPDGDPRLKDKLDEEAEGILAWLVEGAVQYHAEGLNPPAEVAATTRNYFAEQDALGRWVAEHGLCEPREGTSAQELFKRFEQWSVAEGEPLRLTTQKAFSAALQTHGVRSEKTKHGRFYGLRNGPVVTGDGL